MRLRKLLIFLLGVASLAGIGYWQRERIRTEFWPKIQHQYEAARTKYFPGPKTCKYGDPVGCLPEEVCVYMAPDQTQCIRRYVGPTPFIRFPFNPEEEIVCAQGPVGSAGKGHSYGNSLYAVDFASPNQAELGATVYAGMDGTAFVYRGCRDEPENRNDPCGAGFGNHVRIMNPEGYMVMYAHLGAVFVDDGHVIKRGAEIGREGSSGQAGHRHLHMSVHHADFESFIEAVSFFRGQVGATPPSIAFETQICDPADRKECHRLRLRMDQIPCDGKTRMKADWRE
jgi:murein DD-endopeptidase MepM/ murein hydrolase activator NlpD